jgi:hypothetical protein
MRVERDEAGTVHFDARRELARQRGEVAATCTLEIRSIRAIVVRRPESGDQIRLKPDPTRLEPA